MLKERDKVQQSMTDYLNVNGHNKKDKAYQEMKKNLTDLNTSIVEADTHIQEAKAALEQDPKGKEMAEEFLKLSQEIELAKYQGQEVPEEKNEKLQKLTGILGLNTVAMEYLHAFMRFQMMMGDISKSIGDVVKEVAGE